MEIWDQEGWRSFSRRFARVEFPTPWAFQFSSRSKNEIKCQTKYHDYFRLRNVLHIRRWKTYNKFQKLDRNRMKRRASLMIPNEIQNSILHLLENSDPAIPEDAEVDSALVRIRETFQSDYEARGYSSIFAQIICKGCAVQVETHHVWYR
mgnify:CR=1 FL=1